LLKAQTLLASGWSIASGLLELWLVDRFWAYGMVACNLNTLQKFLELQLPKASSFFAKKYVFL